MSVKEIIHLAGNNLHTVIITAFEKDGSIETSEAEPYSYRITAGTERFSCYDIKKEGVRNLLISNIIAIQESKNSFQPRWTVEV